jgi:hypothetical protein
LSDWIGWLLAVPTKKPVDKWTSLGGARQKPKAGNRDECDQLLWASAEHKLFLREEPNFFRLYAFIWATGISLADRRSIATVLMPAHRGFVNACNLLLEKMRTYSTRVCIACSDWNGCNDTRMAAIISQEVANES